MASSEKVKSDLNQTWFTDLVWKSSYVYVAKVTNEGQRSSEVNL